MRLIIGVLFSVSLPSLVFATVLTDLNDRDKDWHNCYDTSIEAALDSIDQRDFWGANDFLSVDSRRVEGETIIIHGSDLYSNKVVLRLNRCPFKKADWDTNYNCEVTVQDQRNFADMNYTKLVETAWKQINPATQLIDCARRTAKVIRNTWKQEFNLAEIKTVKHMIAVGDSIYVGGSGGVVKGGSLHPTQNWSGGLQFRLNYSGIGSQETYDASVDQLSVPKELDAWITNNSSVWQPYNVQITSIKCNDNDAPVSIVNPLAESERPIEVGDPLAAEYCMEPQ